MIAIIDYQSGNTASVHNALTRLGAASVITADANTIQAASGVVFPGQGRAGQAMRQLKQLGVVEVIQQLQQPFLGICLGMQLLVEQLVEDNTKGLGIIPGICKPFATNLPVPHMGWNQVGSDYFYFVHSYYVETKPEYVTATTNYGIQFASAVRYKNFQGVQFHPEKSGMSGERLLKDFLRLC